MKLITINSKVGSGNGIQQDLGISDCYFQSKSYLYVIYGLEITYSESKLNMACYRKSFCGNSLITCLFQTGGGLFQTLTKWTEMFSVFLFFQKSNIPAPLPLSSDCYHSIFPRHFLSKHPKTVKHFIFQSLQLATGPRKGWEDFLCKKFLSLFRRAGVGDGPDGIYYTWKSKHASPK